MYVIPKISELNVNACQTKHLKINFLSNMFNECQENKRNSIFTGLKSGYFD